MIKPLSAALLTTLTLCATASLAQSTRPGLWAVEQKMGGNPELEQAMAQMQKQLASMPPEQRKQMEAMMGQQGVSMGPGKNGGMSLKICITPEMAARQELPSQTEGDCTTTIHSRSASALKMSYVCKNPPSSGEGTYTFSGDTAYTMKMVMNTTRQGKPASMTMEGQGKWLSADCGTIKPMTLPKR